MTDVFDQPSGSKEDSEKQRGSDSNAISEKHEEFGTSEVLKMKKRVDSNSVPEKHEESDSSEEFKLGETIFGDVDSEMRPPSSLFDHSPPPKLEIQKETESISEEGKEINLALERWKKAHTPIKVHGLPTFFAWTFVLG